MAYKMTSDEIEYMAKANTHVYPLNQIRKMEVGVEKAAYGEKVSRIINTRYNGTILNIFGWQTFDVRFSSTAERNEVFAEIDCAIKEWKAAWKAAHPEEYNKDGYPNADPDPEEDPDIDDGGDDDKKSTEGLTVIDYVVIGVAAAVIIVLVWKL